MYALPVLCQMKIHLSKDDMFMTDCPDENKVTEQRHLDHPSYPHLETICQGMLDEFKKQFTCMMIYLLWMTNLDPRCQALRHHNQSEIQAAKNKLIKEVIGVTNKDEECAAEVITIDEEDDSNKEKPSRVLKSLTLHRKQCHHQQQHQIILMWRW